MSNDSKNTSFFPVSVSVSYHLDQPHTNANTRSFEFAHAEPARIGLPIGVAPHKPIAGSFAYSGMHDQGLLPEPRQGGRMAELIACVRQAKATNDSYLTEIITTAKAKDDSQTIQKKAKLQETNESA
jgi:hypothetical protein